MRAGCSYTQATTNDACGVCMVAFKFMHTCKRLTSRYWPGNTVVFCRKHL